MMATVEYFRGNGKLLMIPIVLLLTLIAGAVALEEDDGRAGPSGSLRAVCSVTQYPDLCFSSIASLEASKHITDPEIFFKLSLQVAIQEHVKVIKSLTKLISQATGKQVQEVLKVCGAAFDDALEALNDLLSSMQFRQGQKLFLSPSQADDINTWLTIAMAYQQTCRDSLEELDLDATNSRETIMKNSTQTAGKSLAISAQIWRLVSRYDIPFGRRLASWVGRGKWRHAPGDQVKAECCGGEGPHRDQNGGG